MAERRIVVDGQSYRWDLEDDPRDQSASFSHRGPGYPVTARIVSDGGIKIAFHTVTDFEGLGWWLGSRDLIKALTGAIRIAVRRGETDCFLTGSDVDEAYLGPPRSLTDYLHDAAAALPEAGYPLVVVLLAIGCTTTDADRDTLDDWVASHANEITAAPLASWLAEPDLKDLDAYKTRSAFAFLVEICERVNVDLGLDTTAWDDQLQQRAPHDWRRPWNIPVHHWWWKQGRLDDDGDYYYPYIDVEWPHG